MEAEIKLESQTYYYCRSIRFFSNWANTIEKKSSMQLFSRPDKTMLKGNIKGWLLEYSQIKETQEQSNQD